MIRLCFFNSRQDAVARVSNSAFHVCGRPVCLLRTMIHQRCPPGRRFSEERPASFRARRYQVDFQSSMDKTCAVAG